MEYMVEHLSVRAHWNQNKKIYMMGCLDESVTWGDMMANLPFSHIKKNILIKIKQGKVLHG